MAPAFAATPQAPTAVLLKRPTAAVIPRFAGVFPSASLAPCSLRSPGSPAVGLVPPPPSFGPRLFAPQNRVKVVASTPSSLDPDLLRPSRHRLRPAKAALDLFLPVAPRWARFALPTPPGGLQPPPASSSPTYIAPQKPPQGRSAGSLVTLTRLLLRPPRHRGLPVASIGFRNAFGVIHLCFQKEGRFAPAGNQTNRPSFRKHFWGEEKAEGSAISLGPNLETSWI